MSGRKYKALWEREFPWLSPSPHDPNAPYCKLCRKVLMPKKSTLDKHNSSTGHQQISKTTGATQFDTFIQKRKPEVGSIKLKETELKLAASVCCHTSIQAIDHISEVIQSCADCGILTSLKLHRTKCSRLIDHVLSPCFREELQEDMKGVPYSLLCDESTDISVEKNFCICVIYFSKRNLKINTAYLGLFQVIEATGEALFQTLKKAVTDFGLLLSNCVGFGSDGAANMVGNRNSVWSRIREENPKCILFKCICHSLALCVQKAFNGLPSALGFLLSEIPAWFSKSTLRREEFKALFEEMKLDEENLSEENETTSASKPFLRASSTRWLVRGKVMQNILLNWKILQKYFEGAERTASLDIRFKARILREMLHDDNNYLFFTFLVPIVREFERVNAFFQLTKADPEDMVKELDMLHRSLKIQIKDKNDKDLATSMVIFGSAFQSEIERLKRTHSARQDVFLEGLQIVKTRAHNFLKDLLLEVEKRLPEVRNVFNGLNGLNPKKVLSQVNRLPFDDLPCQHIMKDTERSEIEIQYRKIGLHMWKEESIFNGELPTDSATFWAKIGEYKSSDGLHPYQALSRYALACLSVPVSNAVVERVFSHVTWVKSKHRNRMSIHMLDAILRVRLTLAFRGICCSGLPITSAMMEKFSNSMYILDKDIENISSLL